MSGDLLRKLASIGLTVEQSAAVMDIMAEEAEVRKAKARTRVQKWREKKRDETQRNVTEHNVTQHEGSREGVARVEDKTSNLDTSGKKIDTSPSARSKRGERIPDDFEPDTEWAQAQGLSPSEASIEAAQFIDYWRGKPGKDGMKLDWPATWRMWVRNTIKRLRSAPRATAPPQPQRPRNAGEFARMRLREMGELPDAADNQARYFDQGNAGPNPPSPGIARRFAIASGG